MLTKSVADLARESVGSVIGALKDQIAALDAGALTEVQPDYAAYRQLVGRRQGLAEALTMIEESLNHHDRPDDADQFDACR